MVSRPKNADLNLNATVPVGLPAVVRATPNANRHMRAAIYCRRSREEHQIESLGVQTEGAGLFIKSKGWRLNLKFIEGEDGSDTSRAEFKKRPKLIAMLNAAVDRAFDVLVVRDETRLGGDMIRTTMLLQEIIDAGCRIFYYSTSEEVILNDATSRFLVAARNFSSELEREKVASRTHENLISKARRGLVTGGRCYGYANVPIMSGNIRVGVNYSIDPNQAEVIREIFRKYADGDGLRTIVHDLNARGIPSPRAGKRGTGTWSPSAMCDMLKNERYLGKVIWNRENEGVYRGGTKLREDRPEAEWVTVDRPELRIIDDELWQSVQSRFGAKKKMGRRTSTGPVPRYLLSGFSRCAVCGGPMQVINGKQGKDTIKVYSCAYHRERGTCEVTTRRPVEAVDDVVIEWIDKKLLNEQVVVASLDEIRRRLKHRAEQPSDVPELEKRATKLKAEVRRLGEALLSTDQPLATVTAMLAERESQLRDVLARIAVHQAAPMALDLETRRLEKEARARMADLRGMLQRNRQEGRKVLEKLLTGPLLFTPIQTPQGPRFQISGEANVGNMLGISIEGVPNEIRTRVTALKGPCPGPG